MQSSAPLDEQGDDQQQEGFDHEHLPESSRAQSRKRRLPKRVDSDGALEHLPESSKGQSRKRKLPKWARSDGVMEPRQQAVDEASTSSNQALPPSPPPPMGKPTSFQLHKITGSSEAYILEHNRVETNDVCWYKFSAYDTDKGYWKGKKSKAPDPLPELSLVVEDSYPSIYMRKDEVPFQDRLQGWTYKTTTRPRGTPDTFYYHMGNMFRSLLEVAEYIVYSCYKKLVPVQRHYRSPECLEAEAASVSEQVEGGSSQPIVDDSGASPPLEVNRSTAQTVVSCSQVPSTYEPVVDCSLDGSFFSDLETEDLSMYRSNGVCWVVDRNILADVGDVVITSRPQLEVRQTEEAVNDPPMEILAGIEVSIDKDIIDENGNLIIMPP